MVDPWAEISGTPPHVTVHHTRLEQVAAVTDGHSTIWLDERLSELEARCALMHELVHLRFGHAGHQPESIERKVCERAARLLIPFEWLYRVRHWQGRPDTLAEDLGVTPAVLRDWLRWLTEDEERRVRGMYYLEYLPC